jgi:hypothetical protein
VGAAVGAVDGDTGEQSPMGGGDGGERRAGKWRLEESGMRGLRRYRGPPESRRSPGRCATRMAALPDSFPHKELTPPPSHLSETFIAAPPRNKQHSSPPCPAASPRINLREPDASALHSQVAGLEGPGGRLGGTTAAGGGGGRWSVMAEMVSIIEPQPSPPVAAPVRRR